MFSHFQRRRCKILFLAASPIGEVRVRFDLESREIISQLQNSGRFDFVPRIAVRARDIVEAIMSERPFIVHFSGHGTTHSEICVEDNNGNTVPIGTRALTDLFKLTSTIRCVILNACYSENQAFAISKHIDYVIGMTDEIHDTQAINFSVGFYRAIGSGNSIVRAHEFGCLQIGLENQDRGSNIPILARRANSVNYQFIVIVAMIIIAVIFGKWLPPPKPPGPGEQDVNWDGGIQMCYTNTSGLGCHIYDSDMNICNKCSSYFNTEFSPDAPDKCKRRCSTNNLCPMENDMCTGIEGCPFRWALHGIVNCGTGLTCNICGTTTIEDICNSCQGKLQCVNGIVVGYNHPVQNRCKHRCRCSQT